jgi:hypothetical protein
MYTTLSQWKKDYKQLLDSLEKYSQQRNVLKSSLHDLFTNGSSIPLHNMINKIKMLEMQIQSVKDYIEIHRPPFGSYCMVFTRLYDKATDNDKRKYELIGFCGDSCYNIFSNSIV